MPSTYDLPGFIWNKATELSDGIYRVGVNIEDPNYLFEGLWPIPDGTSINGYAVRGKKKAAIDLTQILFDFPERYTKQLEEIGFALADIDYVIVNHVEPDHSGFLPIMARSNSKAKFYCTPKAVPFMQGFASIPLDRIVEVNDGDILDLGDGKVLQFFHAPNVHWPEVMVTLEKSSGTLFSCDAFGSYGRVDEVFDDHISDVKQEWYIQEAERYYANIVAKFSRFVVRAIKKLSPLVPEISMICPSHGIVWRSKKDKIIDAYARLAKYAEGPAEPEVTVIWGSMYGCTKKMVDRIIQGLHSEGVKVHVYRVPNDDMGFILGSAWRSSGLVLAMPTYEYRMFPPMAHVLDDLGRKEIKRKKVLRLGSFGWSGGAAKEFSGLTAGLDWDCLPEIEWQGHASPEVLEKGYVAARELASQVKAYALK